MSGWRHARCRWLMGIVWLAASAAARADYAVNLPTPATPGARDIFFIHMRTMSIAAVLMAAVVLIVGYSLAVHCKSRGYVPGRSSVTA